MAVLQFAIDVLESIAATVDGGVYNIVSHTPVNPLMLDATAKGLLEQQAGTALEALVNDAGETVGYVAKGVANAGNGAASNVSTYVNVLTQETVVDAEMAAGTYIEASTGEAASLTVGETVTEISAGGTGAGVLAMDVGLAGAAIAPALGVLAGVGLYNLAPEFWTNVSNKLVEAGETVAGKVQALFNSDGTTSFSQGTIEIFKNAFLEAGLFTVPTERTEQSDQANNVVVYKTLSELCNEFTQMRNDAIANRSGMTLYTASQLIQAVNGAVGNTGGILLLAEIVNVSRIDAPANVYTETHTRWGYCANNPYTPKTNDGIITSFRSTNSNKMFKLDNGSVPTSSNYVYSTTDYYQFQCTLNEPGAVYGGDYYEVGGVYYCNMKLPRGEVRITYKDNTYEYNYRIIWDRNFGFEEGTNPNIQTGATLPDANPFPGKYPSWNPNKNIQDNSYYPVSMPTDSITQDPSQTGDNDEDEQKDRIGNILYDPTPDPEPEEREDEDTQDEQETPDDIDVTPREDPVDPNPEPEDSDPEPILPILDTTSATALFTVYNPTDGQLNSLGSYLWSTSIIEQIKQIWQNPIDGVIALHKIYATPSTSGNSNIKLGYLDTGVSSLVVNSQFTEIDCGSLNVPEDKHNATDYSPFTQLQIYLPFIGIQELDANEIVGGQISVKYRIDVYTGTCVALIYCKRSPDMSSKQLLYTFSGNASQKLPLTSSDFGGAISSLLGIVGVGVASGGALGAAAAVGAAHSLTSEMVHIQHSGGLSANSGLLAPRKPFLIISRQHCYDANGYNGFYGYPANKTVYLSNCSGFVKVKDIRYKGDGTESEKDEIINLLKAGVYV